ncbi:MAG TPA: ATP-binding protein [Acidobacteriaceae bacterium]|jgi:signal transduction histidine kinase|nr:ATP-binding protein [Acidobacteriaceae bacterium]
MAAGTELYRIPTLILLIALISVFGALWLERGRHPERDSAQREGPPEHHRQLLWLVGWMFAAIQMETEVLGGGGTAVWQAVARGAMQMAPLMFLGSLAPQYFSRRPRVHYVVAFGTPLIVFAALVSFDPNPGRVAQVVLLVCAFWAAFVAARWSLYRHLIPEWLSLVVVAAVSSACLWLTWNHEYDAVLALVHSGVLLMTAFLFASAFRRLTAGVLFTAGGLALWALPVLLAPLAAGAETTIILVRIINLTKVITAVGMIVLVLEDEIASNRAAQERDRRARQEMEKYTEIYLEDIPFEEESGQYDALCATIASVSRFRKAAIFVRTPDGRFRLAGRAGMNGALEGALDALARRTSEEKVQEIAAGQHFPQQIGTMVLMDLRPLMEPGDELLQMNFLQGHVMGIRTREGRLLGALLLAGLSNPEDPVLTEDVLPLELLVARIGAAREHQTLLRQLLQAERLAGLGQLAGGVAHELNNPLTVVTGYAELMAEDENTAARDQALVILNEARRMKQIIESLMRFRKASTAGKVPLAVELLLRDIEKLARHELESAGVQLELRIPRQVPRVKADGEQMRQVFLQITKNAIASLHEVPLGTQRRLRVEVASAGARVQITFADNGPGFVDPARVFDPFFTTRQTGEGVGLGLSVCYSIVREHGGTITAENLPPHGAAVVIDLPGDPSGLPEESVPGAARAV